VDRFDDGAGGDNEVQRTMLELINQLDGFDPRGNIKVKFHESSSKFLTVARHSVYLLVY
jgi:ATP-dependent 26S proteasome regulatory subunit